MTGPIEAQSSARPSGDDGGGGGGSTTGVGRAFPWKFPDHAPSSTQVLGFLTLVVSGAILLLLTGLTVTATVLGLIFFAPLILLSSPIWIPVGTVLFFVIAGFLTMCGFGIAFLGGLSWIYKYFRGQSKVKDAAPGA